MIPIGFIIFLAALGLALVGLAILIFRIARSEEVKIDLFGIKIWEKSSKIVRDLTGEIRSLDRVADKEAKLIRFIGKLAHELASSINYLEEPDRFWGRAERLLGMIVQFVPNWLSTQGSDCRCCIFTLNQDRRYFRMRHGEGYSADGLEGFEMPVHHSWAGEVFLTGQEMYSGEVRSDPRWVDHPNRTTDYNSLACFPIKSYGVTVAVLNVDSVAVNAFTTDDLAYLRILAAKVGIIIQLLHRLEKKGGRGDG